MTGVDPPLGHLGFFERRQAYYTEDVPIFLMSKVFLRQYETQGLSQNEKQDEKGVMAFRFPVY